MVKGVLTERLVFKPRPEGQDSGHMKSQEKNVLRREKEQGEKACSFPETVKCVWGSRAWRAEQRVQDRECKRSREGQGWMPLAFTSEGKTVECYSSTAGDLQSPKQRRDTLHLNFLEDGSSCCEP